MLDLHGKRAHALVLAPGMFKLSGEKLNLSSGMACGLPQFAFRWR